MILRLCVAEETAERSVKQQQRQSDSRQKRNVPPGSEGTENGESFGYLLYTLNVRTVPSRSSVSAYINLKLITWHGRIGLIPVLIRPFFSHLRGICTSELEKTRNSAHACAAKLHMCNLAAQGVQLIYLNHICILHLFFITDF
jgi:hypothetical protein